MTIAVDLGRKSTKQTNKTKSLPHHADYFMYYTPTKFSSNYLAGFQLHVSAFIYNVDPDQLVLRSQLIWIYIVSNLYISGLVRVEVCK